MESLTYYVISTFCRTLYPWDAEKQIFMFSVKNILRSLLVILSFVVLVPMTASAQSHVSFKLSPTTIEDNIDPGTDRTYTLNVQNLGDAPAKLYPLARNITGIASDLHPIYSDQKDAEGNELASWITYKETQLDLNPGETKELHFSIHFPKSAQPGSHMAGIFISDKSSNDIKNGSAIGFEVGSILNFRVAGDIIEDTQIREFYSTKTIYNIADVGFTVKVENRGNVLSKPRGLIDITNMFGKKVVSLPVNDNAAGVFPKATREYKASWKPEDIQMGRFEAVVALAIEGVNGTQTISRVVQFWVLPMNILMPFFGGLLFIIILVYVLLRMYIRGQLQGTGTRQSRGAAQATKGLSRLAAIVIALLIAVILGLMILFFVLM